LIVFKIHFKYIENTGIFNSKYTKRILPFKYIYIYIEREREDDDDDDLIKKLPNNKRVSFLFYVLKYFFYL